MNKLKKKEVLNLAKIQAQQLARIDESAIASQDPNLPVIVTANVSRKSTTPARVVLLKQHSFLINQSEKDEGSQYVSKSGLQSFRKDIHE